MRIEKLVILFVLSLSITGCLNDKNVELKVEDKSGQQALNIKQSESDLLAGISTAVCYSGFRNGQHPDRGNGAINPTYHEILEDLQLLLKNDIFKLIRLYDSGENSEMVLQVIKENNLDIKVMLGIWLKAELSNHETCTCNKKRDLSIIRRVVLGDISDVGMKPGVKTPH